MKKVFRCDLFALRALPIFALGMQVGVTGFCQAANSVVGAGYAPPVPIAATAGQLLTIYVQGVGAGLTGRTEAKSIPLPTSLVGISVSLEQTLVPRGPI